MNVAVKSNEIGSSAEGALLVALTEAGFPVSSVAALRDQFDMLPCPLAALLLTWIPRLADRRLQESVMWALLSAPTGSLDGVALTELFDATEHDELKWAIAAVINQTRPQHVDEWLMTAVCDPRSGAARNHLASAIAKMVSPEHARPVLLDLFRDAPLAAVHPLGKVGDLNVRDFLIAQQVTAIGPLRRELRQAIARIERRLMKTERNQSGGKP